ncbi:MAG: hypothetical protein R3B91_22725, partial [Planctomycetaceae bacterium]
MPSEMVDWIRDIVAKGIRRPGSPENLATEDFLAKKIEEFGLTDIRREPVDVHYWASTEVALLLGEHRKQIPCCGVPYTAWSPAEGIEAEAVSIGHGSAAELDAVDLDGRIAVMELRFGTLSVPALRSGAHFVHDPHDTIPNGTLHCANGLIENFPAY